MREMQELAAEVRTGTGKGPAYQSRQKGLVPAIVYGGEAAGYVLTFEDGRVIYFAGDTNVFSDMELIAEIYKPELAFLPIGDFYTMSPREAAVACRLLGAKTVIPMHFGTFPTLIGRPNQLQDLAPRGVEIRELTPGKPIDW